MDEISMYQDTKLGKIPLDWRCVRQYEVSTFHNGRAYKLSEWETEGTPVIRLQNLTGSGQDYYYSNLELPERQYVNNGDLLFMWSATFGPKIWNGDKAIYHYHIWKVDCKEELLDKSFMFYNLDYMTEVMKSQTNGSTMLHLTKKGMEEQLMRLPPLSEQQKISEILITIDKKGDLLTQKIEQTKELKKGLMQKFFADNTEELELGKLLSGKPTYGANAPAISFNEGDTRYIRITDINERGQLSDKKVSLDSESAITYKLKNEDIIIARSGNTVGKSFMYEDKYGDCAYAGYLIKFNTDAERLLPRYLKQFLHSSEYWNWVKSNLKPGAQPNINSQQYQSLKIPLVSIKRQKEIIDILEKIDYKLDLLTSQNQQVRVLKKGLMQKLLTGKLRVNANKAFEAVQD